MEMVVQLTVLLNTDGNVLEEILTHLTLATRSVAMDTTLEPCNAMMETYSMEMAATIPVALNLVTIAHIMAQGDPIALRYAEMALCLDFYNATMVI